MQNIFPQMSGLKVIVAGDIMLDVYYRGNVERISPEAPVPVLRVEKKFIRPGGAANVALNLLGLTCRPVLLGMRGGDSAGKALAHRLDTHHLESVLIPTDAQPTTTKTRLIGQGQQLIRMDEEKPAPPEAKTLTRLIDAFKQALPDTRAVILSDYNKGIFFTGLAPTLIGLCRKNNIPVFVDPKGTDWARYRSSTCMTPNLNELNRLYPEPPDHSPRQLITRARQLIDRLDLAQMLVTLGDQGLSLIDRSSHTHIPARSREIWDVSGAGDTVIATLAAASAAGASGTDAAHLANVAAGVAVEKLGTHPVSLAELKYAFREEETLAAEKFFAAADAIERVNQWRADGRKIVFTNGCFDILHVGHIKLLQAAAKQGDRLVVALNSDASVKRLKGPGRPVISEQERAVVMANIGCVDMVVLFDEDTPLEIIRQLRPDILVKGGDYTPETVVGREEVESRGGQVVLVPLVAGKSTSQVIDDLQSGK